MTTFSENCSRKKSLKHHNLVGLKLKYVLQSPNYPPVSQCWPSSPNPPGTSHGPMNNFAEYWLLFCFVLASLHQTDFLSPWNLQCLLSVHYPSSSGWKVEKGGGEGGQRWRWCHKQSVYWFSSESDFFSVGHPALLVGLLADRLVDCSTVPTWG